MSRVICSFFRWGLKFRIVVKDNDSNNNVTIEYCLKDSMGNDSWIRYDESEKNIIQVLKDTISILADSEKEMIDRCKSCGMNSLVVSDRNIS